MAFLTEQEIDEIERKLCDDQYVEGYKLQRLCAQAFSAILHEKNAARYCWVRRNEANRSVELLEDGTDIWYAYHTDELDAAIDIAQTE